MVWGSSPAANHPSRRTSYSAHTESHTTVTLEAGALIVQKDGFEEDRTSRRSCA